MAPLAAAAAADLCTAFVAHFFSGADEAVLQYVQQSLLTAIEEGDSLPEQAAELEGFLPPSCSPGALQGGLRELEHAAQHEQQPHLLQQSVDYAWKQVAAAQAPGLGQHDHPQQQQPGGKPTLEAAQAPAAAAAPALPPLPLLPEGAAGKQQAAAAVGGVVPRNSGSTLSVSAAEFKPAGAAGAGAGSALSAGLGTLHLGAAASSSSDSGAAAGWDQPSDGAAEWWGVYDGAEGAEEEADEPSSGWQHSGSGSGVGSGTGVSSEQQQYARPAPSQWAAAAAAAEVQAAAGGGLAAPAFLAVLADQFPLWSAGALQELFEEQGGDIAATVQTLCSLESELEGQQQAGADWAPGSSGNGSGTEDAVAAPPFTDNDFPSLESSSSTSSRPGAVAQAAGSSAGAAQYASAARAAAELPAERMRLGAASTHLPHRAIGSSNPAAAAAASPSQSRAAAVAAAAGLGPAPIWQQDEGVARYATGKALAAEYAALRADARDHARLRNAYFQQATQAYQAGDRSLAKELGARGRWHNEQMHAAHQAAASQLFVQRNSAATRPAAGSGGRQGGGVPTIDLHGLHVSEALDCLQTLLDRMRGPASGSRGAAQRRLRIVVGEGKHGRVPARLPACVRRHLESQGVAFTEPYAGLLEIRL